MPRFEREARMLGKPTHQIRNMAAEVYILYVVSTW
jgi:hypothetical protein